MVITITCFQSLHTTYLFISRAIRWSTVKVPQLKLQEPEVQRVDYVTREILTKVESLYSTTI